MYVWVDRRQKERSSSVQWSETKRIVCGHAQEFYIHFVGVIDLFPRVLIFMPCERKDVYIWVICMTRTEFTRFFSSISSSTVFAIDLPYAIHVFVS